VNDGWIEEIAPGATMVGRAGPGPVRERRIRRHNGRNVEFGTATATVLNPDARTLLARHGFDPVLGARPLRRTIPREIEDQLPEKILFGEIEPAQIVLVDVEGFDVDDTTTTAATTAGWSVPTVGVPVRPPATVQGFTLPRHRRLVRPLIALVISVHICEYATMSWKGHCFRRTSTQPVL
jgi:hypothetical protein